MDADGAGANDNLLVDHTDQAKARDGRLHQSLRVSEEQVELVKDEVRNRPAIAQPQLQPQPLTQP